MSITVFSLYSTLSLINFYYYCTRIRPLKEKSFHRLMFTVLQVCYAFYLVEYIVYWYFKYSKWVNILYMMYFTTNEVAHLIFVLKYWILARKIHQIMCQYYDAHFQTKVYLVAGCTLLIIYASSAFYLINRHVH